MKNSRISSFTLYSLTTSLTQGIVLVFAVAASVITARTLGPAGKGQLVLALLIPSLATTLGRMGIGHAINFYSSKTERGLLIFNSIVLGAIIGSFLIVVMSLVVFVFKVRFFAELSNELLLIVVLCIPVYLLNNITYSLIQGMYDIPLFNRLNALQAVSNVVLLLLIVYIFQKGVTGAVLVNIIAMSIVVYISLILLLKMVRPVDAFLDWSIIGTLLKFGSKSHIGNILKDLSYRGDILIISYFLTPASVGYYVVAVTFSEILWKLPDAISTVLLPKVAGMTPDTAKFFTPKACRMIFIPTIITCITIFFLSKFIIIGLFGIEFEPSAFALMFLLPGVLALSMWKILANDLIGQGYPILYSITSGAALVTMVFVDIMLVPSMGIIGASIGSSVSYIVATIIICLFYMKINGTTVANLLIPRREDISYLYEVLRSSLLAFHIKI